VLYPLFDDLRPGRSLFGAGGVVVLVLALWVISRGPTVKWIAWIVAVPAVVLTVLSALTDNVTLLALSSALEALVYFYAAGSLIAYMLADTKVTTDELYAVGATFTLIAWGFAYAFLVCQVWYPGSFDGAVNPGEPRPWIELLFLSFTNLSGVGVSDVVPVASPARVLVMLEQFAGVGYLAMVVSRLIGLTITRRLGG
jgi:hypothetical protein